MGHVMWVSVFFLRLEFCGCDWFLLTMAVELDSLELLSLLENVGLECRIVMWDVKGMICYVYLQRDLNLSIRLRVSE